MYSAAVQRMSELLASGAKHGMIKGSSLYAHHPRSSTPLQTGNVPASHLALNKATGGNKISKSRM